MKYFNDDEYNQLISNGSDWRETKDYPPVVKLFMTNTDCVWLISELNPQTPDIAFGLCDLGMGFPEVGYVSISEIEEAQGMLRYLERDLSFTGKHPLTVYARAARTARCIVTDDEALAREIPKLQP